ncbi:MAG: chorismate mutase [Candidatus Neomarinimicrobiota bacterium]|nr:chorismate mutase [Candidatus Neomarinimicrobiota bacterium]
MNTKNKIDELRSKIDDYDDKILDLLVKRFELSDKIGSIKQNSNSEILDTDREKQIINRLINKFSTIDKEHIKSIFFQIFNVSKLIQERKK